MSGRPGPEAATRSRAVRMARMLFVAMALMLVADTGSAQVRRTLPPLLIVQYELVDSSPQPDGTDYIFRARLLNLGPAIPGAVARLIGTSSAATLLDDQVSFGPVAPSRSAWSVDTFAIRRDGRWSDVLMDFRWEITVVGVNQPPVAEAGPDVTARVFDRVRLDGSGSTDPDGDPLIYQWSWEQRPGGSLADLSDDTAVRPEFTIDLPGQYVLALVVHDGAAASAPDLVTVTTENSPPVADAGDDRTVALHATVQLDGSRSSDADGDALTFEWLILDRPATSQAMLDDPAAVRPSLVIDAPGTYIVQLTVGDGLAVSQPDTVMLRTENSPPVADAGADQTVTVGQQVTLDGSGSTDVDGDPLTYAWSLIGLPAGSAATLQDAGSVTPQFDVDLPGVYVAQLVVHDGIVGSDPDTVTVTTSNSRPVADAGPDQTVSVGQVAVVDGSGSSDADGDALTFGWALTARPAGSVAAIADPASPVTSFIADVPGDYAVQLVVNDGQLDSDPDTALVSTVNSVPTADAGPDQLGVPIGSVVTLDGSNSSDPDGSVLTYAWSLLSRPAGSAALLSGADTVQPELTPDVAGDYVAQLIVNDGFADSAPDTVRVQAVEPAIVTIYATDDQASEIGPDPGTFTIARTGPTSEPLDVHFVVQGSATNGEDYDAIPSLVTVPAGAAEATITIVPVDDGLLEGTETVILSLVEAPGYTVGSPGLAAVSIADSSRPIVTVTATIPEAHEAGLLPGAFTFMRTGPTESALLVTFSRSGTATNGVDYVSLGGSTTNVTIPAGEASVVVPVVPLADNVVEGPETVIVTINAASAYVIGTPESAEVTIVDDPPVVTIEAVDPDAAERLLDPGTIALSRSGGNLAAALDVALEFGGTATTLDYVAVPATATIPAGATVVHVVIEPLADNLVEGPETVIVTIAPRNAYVVSGSPSATITIADDPAVVTVVATDPDASEAGPDTGTFTFSRSGGNLAEGLTVWFARSGTATNGVDYESIGGSTSTITIPAGQESGVVTITPIPDAVVEPTETVVATLVTRAVYVIGTPDTATVFIHDAPP
jgi:hypothetical protein